LESEEASEGHSPVETVTVNKQIEAQVSLIVRDKQQLIKTINKQKCIISVFVSRQLQQTWTFRGPPTQ
jgi:pyruvate kinase